jgi:hypothetical protein
MTVGFDNFEELEYSFVANGTFKVCISALKDTGSRSMSW